MVTATGIISAHVTVIMDRLGITPDARSGTQGTPERVERALREMTSGYSAESQLDLRTFDEEADQMVCQWNIPFASLCEHHMLPFLGFVHIGYLPKGKVIGLSKFKRLVDVYAKRLQIQERFTREVCDHLTQATEPRGAMVVAEAQHTCMVVRGICMPGTVTTTSAVSGDFTRVNEGSREEFLSLLAHNKRSAV